MLKQYVLAVYGNILIWPEIFLSPENYISS